MGLGAERGADQGALDGAAKAINELKGALEGLGNKIVTEFKDPIIGAADALEKFVGDADKVLDTRR